MNDRCPITLKKLSKFPQGGLFVMPECGHKLCRESAKKQFEELGLYCPYCRKTYNEKVKKQIEDELAIKILPGINEPLATHNIDSDTDTEEEEEEIFGPIGLIVEGRYYPIDERDSDNDEDWTPENRAPERPAKKRKISHTSDEHKEWYKERKDNFSRDDETLGAFILPDDVVYYENDDVEINV